VARLGTFIVSVRSGAIGGLQVVIINKDEGWVGYRLNILGIRVWPDKCQLVARTGEEWITLGPPRPLPLRVPTTADELARAANDALLITAYQFIAEYPSADLADMLAQRRDFAKALDSQM
jgi:hypothetical protein